jgi:hypothetical protein
MGLTVCPITPVLAELSKEMPLVACMPTAKGSFPTFEKNSFDKIVEAGGVTLSTAAPADSMPTVSLPSSWDDIDVGKLVLARDKPQVGWWEWALIGGLSPITNPGDRREREIAIREKSHSYFVRKRSDLELAPFVRN